MLHRTLVLVAAALLAGSVSAQGAFVTRFVPPEDGTYNRSLVLRFVVVFSAPVQVSGSPRLAVNVGDASRHATWNAPLGAGPVTILELEYSPQPYDEAPAGISVADRLDLNGGMIRGADGASADVSFVSPSLRKVRVALLPPPAPRILGIDFEDQGGAEGGERIRLHGTADGGSVVLLRRAGAAEIGQVLAEQNGAWVFSYPVYGVARGYAFTATALDQYGFESDASAPATLVVKSGSAPSSATRASRPRN